MLHTYIYFLVFVSMWLNSSDHHEGTKDTVSAHAKINKIYNTHRRDIHLNNGYKSSSLIDDDINQIHYPQQAGRFSLYQDLVFEMLNSYTSVIPSDKEAYEATMNDIFSALKDKSVMIVTNHATFAWIPVLISELNKYAKKFNKKSIWDTIKTIIGPAFAQQAPKKVIPSIHTILGPALVTQSQKKVIQAISHLWKTIPVTQQSSIPEFEQMVQEGKMHRNPLDRVRVAFLKAFKQKSQEPGNIFIIAPTGTRDTPQRDLYKEIQKIYFESDETLEPSCKMIANFAEKGNPVILAGINEIYAKAPGETWEKDNSRNPWCTFISTKKLSQEECSELFKEKKIMKTLAGLVKNKYGTSLWQALPAEELKMKKEEVIKHNAEATESEFVFQDLQFHDTLRKIVVRKVFECLNDR